VRPSDIWAAIDIKGGRVTTLLKGRAGSQTVWEGDPAFMARRWEKEGANGLHVVDLDAALGTGSNRESALAVMAATRARVEVAGGIRDAKEAESWLRLGAERVVIGTMAYRDGDAFARLVKMIGTDRVVAAVDYSKGRVMHDGWKAGGTVPVLEAIRQLESAGVSTFLATCIDRDGTGRGADLKMLKEIRKATAMKILASGGIRDVDEIVRLEEMGVDGVVLGRALYDGSISLAKVKRMFR
jgi:phosphoribosylformimino-5-aminoimidazole carboxamide ribotide isomerase